DTRTAVENGSSVFSGTQSKDVGRTTAAIAAIVEGAAVGRPHRRLFIECGEGHALRTVAVKIEDPDVRHTLLRVDDSDGVAMTIRRQPSVRIEEALPIDLSSTPARSIQTRREYPCAARQASIPFCDTLKAAFPVER